MHMNDTMDLLEDLVANLSRARLARDELYQRHTEERQARWAAFQETHPEELTNEVLELLDMDSDLDLTKYRLRFFMGLQLGLELGRLDLLGAE